MLVFQFSILPDIAASRWSLLPPLSLPQMPRSVRLARGQWTAPDDPFGQGQEREWRGSFLLHCPVRKIQMDNSLEFVEEESPKGSKVREALPSCLLFQTNISEVLSDDADDANFVFFFKGAMPIQCG